MILIINTCKEELHYYEFVKPVEDIAGTREIVKSIKIADLKKKDVLKSEKIIITGTSLMDFDYEKKNYSWIKKYDKPLLGICAGAQLIAKEFGCSLGKGTEIGLHDVKFKKIFLGMKSDETIQAYCLHNSIINNSQNLRAEFEICGSNEYIQAIKHKHKPIYATLFHPEVRNKKVIEAFLRINIE
jgi:GMP synthase (glutamine-hydrolysing)